MFFSSCFYSAIKTVTISMILKNESNFKGIGCMLDILREKVHITVVGRRFKITHHCSSNIKSSSNLKMIFKILQIIVSSHVRV